VVRNSVFSLDFIHKSVLKENQIFPSAFNPDVFFTEKQHVQEGGFSMFQLSIFKHF